MDAVNQAYNYSGDIMSHVSMYVHRYVHGAYKEAEQRKNGVSETSSLRECVVLSKGFCIISKIKCLYTFGSRHLAAIIAY